MKGVVQVMGGGGISKSKQTGVEESEAGRGEKREKKRTENDLEV